MSRQFSKPIRTYERKKRNDVAVVFPNSHTESYNKLGNNKRTSLRKRLNEAEKEEVNDNSLYYDPFDTTFDRLAKAARIPPPVAKVSNNESSYNSTDNSSSWQLNQSGNKSIKLDDNNKELILMPDVIYKKRKMQVIKKTIKKNPSRSQKNVKFKVKKDDACKRYMLRKRKKNNKSTSIVSNTDSLNLHSETGSEIENYNGKHSSHKNKKNTSKLNKQSTKNVQIKPCSVVLHKYSITENNNEINSIGSTSSVNIKNLECNNAKHCFSKQLGIDSFAKSINFGKKNEKIFSSTPYSRTVKSVNLIPLSPIPIGCSKNLNHSMSCSDNVLSTVDNKDLIPNRSNQANTLDKKSNVLGKFISERESDLFSTGLTNISNSNKCNIKPLENSLTMFSYTDNNICNQEKFSIEQNIFTNEIEKNDMSNKSVQECVITDTRKTKCQLNFSVDADKSHSLFDDTNEHTENQIYSDVIVHDVIKASPNNIMLNKTNTPLREICYNSVQLSEKQISITNTDMKVICDEVKEKSSELLHSSKSVILDASSDNVQFTSKAVETDDNDDNKENILEHVESLAEPNINNSVVNNNSMHDCYVILKRLQDPIRVSTRKKSYRRNSGLTSILEDCSNSTEQLNLRRKNELKRKETLARKELLPLENIMEESVIEKSVEIIKPIFLKPGKSWARSLSILNNIQNLSKLDKLSIGKGKKWRHSVQDVLNMQKQGILQSCIKENSSDKDLQVCNEESNESESILDNSKSRTCDSTNFGHLSRRVSVRVVPIHKTVKSISDVPFLEVYGIVPLKNQRYTLISTSEKSSVCSIQNDDFNDQIIKEHVPLTAKEVILQRCSQEDYIPFSSYFTDSYLEYCRKIGEGVYGEVFLYEHGDKKSVVKVIPIEGTEYINGEPQKKFHEILSEIVIAMELHNLRFNKMYKTDGFVEVKNIKCIKGKYPEKLVALWNMYDEEKHSDNDCPSIFNDDQLYIVLELGHGGQDLEAFVFPTAEEAYILFIQTSLALAVAEKAVEFEHRDLHWGNILISPTNESHVYYKLGRKNIKLISKGVQVSIIDFTLSRVTYQGCSVFNDLALDPTLFTAQGEYQFEIYRLMRDKIMNDWQKFEPYTNVLWLHYTLDKMITAVRYKKRNVRSHKNGIKKLQELKNEILKYSSAFDFVTNCDQIANLVYNDS
ncbi:haspin isoform X1 [Megachile rotundata]|uniref:haspin isoform X1 n=1 Tax=Megachile rotundata TaxID=143995 RepID=UPI003FD67B9F